MTRNRASAKNLCGCGCGVPVKATYAKGHHRRRPLAERLMEKVRKEASGCWTWTGAVNTNGYGAVGSGVGNGVTQAHRASYETFRGPIPPGLHIDHLCRNRLCINPDHLEPVTQAVNNKRAWDANPRTHCRRGHALSADNVLNHKRGPTCRTCHNARNRAARRGVSIDQLLEAGE